MRKRHKTLDTRNKDEKKQNLGSRFQNPEPELRYKTERKRQARE